MKTVTQYYGTSVRNPVTQALETVRMEVVIDFEAVAAQLGPKARASKKRRAAALFGAVTVRALPTPKHKRP